MARRGAPKRRQEPVEDIHLYMQVSYVRKLDERRSTLSRREYIEHLLDAAEVNVADLMVERDEYKVEAEKWRKAYEELEAKLLRFKQENEKLRLIRQVLEEENKQLKAENAELRRQLKMSARERRAEDFKQEIYEVINRYGKNGSIKMLELLKRLGYSSNFDHHAKELIERWFVDEGYKLVSDDLGLVIEKKLEFGRLAWIVRAVDGSFRFFEGKNETETGEVNANV